jgi:hypothetical protein
LNIGQGQLLFLHIPIVFNEKSEMTHCDSGDTFIGIKW